MFDKLKKEQRGQKVQLLNIRWYPNSKSCVSIDGRKVNPELMPPLMVRKAEWRRY